MSAPAVPAAWRRLVDDAAIFPPGNAAVPAAVVAHRGHREAAYGDLVGPFVVDDGRVGELIDVLRGSPGEPLAVTLVVKGGVDALGGAVRHAGRAPVLDLRGVEVTLAAGADLAAEASRMNREVERLVAAGDLAVDTVVFVELPRLSDAATVSWSSAVDEVDAAGHRLKFRTGGVTANAFPDSASLAVGIQGAVRRGMVFKCTAGLHSALRHRDEPTGLERHGFLNVLAATAAAADGAGTPDLAELLEQRNSTALLGAAESAGGSGWLESARERLTSFGCCDVLDPLRDLVTLGLISSRLSR